MYISTKRGLAETRANINVRAQYAVSSLANSDYFDQLMTGPELLRYYEETGIYKHDSDDPRETTIVRLKDIDRKSTRLNSSHANISYAVFCLKKKKKKQ